MLKFETYHGICWVVQASGLTSHAQISNGAVCVDCVRLSDFIDGEFAKQDDAMYVSRVLRINKGERDARIRFYAADVPNTPTGETHLNRRVECLYDLVKEGVEDIFNIIELLHVSEKASFLMLEKHDSLELEHVD